MMDLINSDIEKVKEKIIAEFFRGKIDERHNFQISPENAPLTSENLSVIRFAGHIMPSYIEGALKIVNLAMIDDKLRHKDRVFRLIRRLLNLEGLYQSQIEFNKAEGLNGGQEINSELEQRLLAENGLSLPHPFVRLDCIRDENGKIKIVEIEENKLHGLGYATLCREFSETPVGEGLVKDFVDITKNNPGLILLAASERFYITELKYFCRVVNEQGGNLEFASQSEIELTEEGILVKKDFGRTVKMFTNIINLPNLSGEKTMADKTEKGISNLHLNGTIKVKSFNRPFLGEKALMGLISNAFQDEELERVLNLCFHPLTLGIIRDLIPRTFIPMNKQEKQHIENMIRLGERLFVKVINASGARGVASHENRDMQLELLSQGNVIVQDSISVSRIELPFYDLLYGESGVNTYSVRYASFVINGQLTDIAATASPSIIAHGGRTSIQTGIKVI